MAACTASGECSTSDSDIPEFVTNSSRVGTDENAGDWGKSPGSVAATLGSDSMVEDSEEGVVAEAIGSVGMDDAVVGVVAVTGLEAEVAG